MIYDFITIGSGAAGLFFNINLPENSKKLILEKNKILWTKILMSGWERANLTNINIEPTKDYFSCNTKATIGFFKRFTNYGIIDFFESNWVKTIIEDRWRVITASGHARDIVQVLTNKVKKNNTNILTEKDVISVEKQWEFYICRTFTEEFQTKNLIIAVWWKSYPQVWTVWFGYKIAKQFWLDIITPYKGLVWIITKQDLSKFSWSNIICKIKLLKWEKEIYNEYWPLLFTHRWVSWPIIYNTVLALWKEINCKNRNLNYHDFKLIIEFDLENTTKKIKKELNLSEEKSSLKLNIQKLKNWKEAKITWWWINTNELTKYLESKKHPWLFFIWEIIDITWKTWGFNLQWAWTSAYCCAEKFI